MAKDYKDRANQKNNSPQTRVAWWKWLLVIFLLSLFIGFLTFLQSSAPKATPTTQAGKITKKTKQTTSKPKKKTLQKPKFDFYTILPETEIIVPDYAINTGSREEQLVKTKNNSQYLIQAGSFKQFSEADKLRARLALLGIESKVEKAKIGHTIWNRVKIGPYSQLSSVNVIKKQLKGNNIDIIVTELSK